MEQPCEICDNPAEYSEIKSPRLLEVRRCPRCGEFEFDGSVSLPKIRSPDEMVRLSGWVREQNAAGVVPVPITPEIWRRVVQMRPPGLRERANRVLAAVAKKFPRRDLWFGEESVVDLEIQGISYSRDEREVLLLMDILHGNRCFHCGSAGFSISVNGFLAAEALEGANSSSVQGFVAMWFDESLQDAWTSGFDPGIRAAGFHPVRIDNKDYVGGISDEIMAEIRRSRFVVADYTGQRNGVYFEAGFALGLGLTVIPTCRADDVDELGFDIKHLNTLLCNSPAELAEGLNRRIRAVVGGGPDALDPM